MISKINYLIENKEIRCEMSKNTNLDKDKLKIENVINQWKHLFDNI